MVHLPGSREIWMSACRLRKVSLLSEHCDKEKCMAGDTRRDDCRRSEDARITRQPGVCQEAGPHHCRNGRGARPHATRQPLFADMSKHALLRTDSSLKVKNRENVWEL